MAIVNHGIVLRLKVNQEQESILNQNVGNARWIYNEALSVKIRHYESTGKFLSYKDLSSVLTKLKSNSNYEWLKISNASSLQNSLKDLDTAFKNFFSSKNGSRKGEQMGFPKFKKKNRARKSFRITNTNDNIRIQETTTDHWQIKLGKLGFFSVCNWKERLAFVYFSKKINNATIYQDSDSNWYASLSVESEKQIPNINDVVYKNALGIDVGLKDLAALSTGEKVGSIEATKKYEKKLAKLQKVHARMVKFSKNWFKMKKRIAKVHFKIKMTRQDYLHKLSRYIIDNFDVITMETLSIKSIMQNGGLAKKTADQAWYKFKIFLKYKAEWAGKKIIEVSKWFPSSKTCSCCGIQVKLTLDIRNWKCPKCKSIHDRDINASMNLEKVSKYFIKTGVEITSKEDFLEFCFATSEK